MFLKADNFFIEGSDLLLLDEYQNPLRLFQILSSLDISSQRVKFDTISSLRITLKTLFSVLARKRLRAHVPCCYMAFHSRPQRPRLGFGRLWPKKKYIMLLAVLNFF